VLRAFASRRRKYSRFRDPDGMMLPDLTDTSGPTDSDVASAGLTQNCYYPGRREADRMNRPGGTDVESPSRRIGQPRFAVAKGPVDVTPIRRNGSRKHFVQGGESRLLTIDPRAKLVLISRDVGSIGKRCASSNNLLDRPKVAGS